MGKLTTHILDTAAGGPAAGVRIELHRVEPDGGLLLDTVSNRDGRCDHALLEGDALVRGVYELCFHMGDYFRGRGLSLPEPPFVDKVTIRFGIAEPQQHYHVPLLVSPWSHSTYRGS